jgi:hypothetical protein
MFNTILDSELASIKKLKDRNEELKPKVVYSKEVDTE